MNRYFPLVPTLAIAAAVTIISQPVLALERSEIAAKVKQFTVAIEGVETTGTGTIIEQNGNSYTVLTCWHVMEAEGNFEVTTADGQQHRVTEVKNLDTADLAIVTFSSSNSYNVAELGNGETTTEGANAYVVGYPDPIPGIPERVYNFLATNIVSKLSTGEEGYQIVHSNPTTGGSSGGGIFDGNGYLVGINGSTTSDAEGRVYYGLAIPLQLYVVAKSRFNSPTNITTPQDSVKRDSQEIVEEFNRTLARGSRNLEALEGRAKAYHWLEDFPAAIADFSAAIKINPNNVINYYSRGIIYAKMGEPQKALADFSAAIKINPDFTEAYNSRGSSYNKIEEPQKAISDFSAAIKINPNYAEAYYNRGTIYRKINEPQKAISDFSAAIKINPNYAKAYYNRGDTREELGDKTQAIQDFQQAADLFKEQGNGELHLNALTKVLSLTLNWRGDNAD